MNRALWYRRFGQPEAVLSLETAPLATPAAAQVQVQMIAAPITPSDVIPIVGWQPFLDSQGERWISRKLFIGAAYSDFTDSGLVTKK